jgi:hypothetical protein
VLRFIMASGHPANPSIKLSQAPLGIQNGISVGLVVATGTVAILAFQAISFLAQMVATPLIFGICIGLVVHIALNGPKESIECGTEILQKTPRAVEALIKKTPLVLHQIADGTKQLSHTALQEIGSRVNPPSKTPYTLRQVANGLVAEGRSKLEKAHKKHSPLIREYARSSWDFLTTSAN